MKRMKRIWWAFMNVLGIILMGHRRVKIVKRNSKTKLVRLRDGNVIKVKNRRLF